METTPEEQEWFDNSKITITYDRDKIVMFVNEVQIYNLTIKCELNLKQTSLRAHFKLNDLGNY